MVKEARHHARHLDNEMKGKISALNDLVYWRRHINETNNDNINMLDIILWYLAPFSFISNRLHFLNLYTHHPCISTNYYLNIVYAGFLPLF